MNYSIFKEKVKKTIKNKTFFTVLKQKLKRIFFIKNNVIKNMQLQDEEYRRLKRKYKYVIDNFKNDNISSKSNKVWICWFQGLDNAPEMVKCCVKSIKKYLKDKEIIVITIDNYKEYVEFPDYIEEKFKKGIITYTHFSDLLRIELLSKYGGIWIDSTVLFTGKLPDYIINSELFIYKHISLDKSDRYPTLASSWFISSDSHNNIIELTKSLLYEYWKKEKHLTNYFLLHLFFKIAVDKYCDDWEKIPTFNNITPHILQFELLNKYDENRFKQILGMTTIHKLNRYIERNEDTKSTFYEYILDNQDII